MGRLLRTGFSIEVTLEDGTIQTVNNEEELDALFEECYGQFEIHGEELMMSGDQAAALRYLLGR